MNKWIFSRESTSQSIMDYLLKGSDQPEPMKHPEYPIGIYVFGIDEVRHKVADQVKQSINDAGKTCYFSQTMFSLPYFGSNNTKIMLIDLPNVASRSYSSNRGTTGGTMETLPDYGLRFEVADRLRKAGAKTVIAVYAAAIVHSDCLQNYTSIDIVKYLNENDPQSNSPSCGDFFITIKESAFTP